MKKTRIMATAILLFVAPQVVHAEGGTGDSSAPTPPPTSQGSANVVLNTLEAGAGGTYTPLTAQKITPVREDNTNPLLVPPPPDPQGKACPTITVFHIHGGGGGVGAPGGPTGSIVSTLQIYPTFTRNALGGYDGSDPQYGYAVPDAIPAGGDPSATAIGTPVTAATAGGHVIAVGAFLQQYGTWHDATPGHAPYGGSCEGASFTFGTPFIAGNAPPPQPSTAVLNTPPFALGSQLMAEVTRTWRIGTLDTLPGPGQHAATFVHVPTCAWLDTAVPSQTTAMHAVKTVDENGITLFLVYNLDIVPGPITWSWGDGASDETAAAANAPPPSLPVYDPTSQTWSDPCSVSHAYNSVSNTRTITATQVFSVAITVSWDDGVAQHTATVPCDPTTGGSCQLTVGAANGWSSGPHPVEQIEPVPYVLPSPTPF